MEEICKSRTTIFDFLELRGYSHKKIKRLFHYGGILIDDEITKRDREILPGMKIEIFSLQKPPSIDILFEDKDIIVVNKPHGLLTIATDLEKVETLYHKVLLYLKERNKHNYLFIVHRLDRDTSGVVLFAKNKKIKDALQKNWNTLAYKRIYVALSFGRFTHKSGTIRQYLCENDHNMVYETTKEKGRLAITSYQVVKENASFSLVSVSIQTGRKNQIRLALSSLGHPIVGDFKYGSENKSKRLYLHAQRLCIVHPFTKKKMEFYSEVPKEFDKMFKKV